MTNYTYNKPETHYIQSTETIEGRKRDITGHEPVIISTGKYGGYQSPSKVIRKEEKSQPEEFKQEEKKF